MAPQQDGKHTDGPTPEEKTKTALQKYEELFGPAAQERYRQEREEISKAQAARQSAIRQGAVELFGGTTVMMKPVYTLEELRPNDANCIIFDDFVDKRSDADLLRRPPKELPKALVKEIGSSSPSPELKILQQPVPDGVRYSTRARPPPGSYNEEVLADKAAEHREVTSSKRHDVFKMSDPKDYAFKPMTKGWHPGSARHPIDFDDPFRFEFTKPGAPYDLRSLSDFSLRETIDIERALLRRINRIVMKRAIADLLAPALHTIYHIQGGPELPYIEPETFGSPHLMYPPETSSISIQHTTIADANEISSAQYPSDQKRSADGTKLTPRETHCADPGVKSEKIISSALYLGTVDGTHTADIMNNLTRPCTMKMLDLVGDESQDAPDNDTVEADGVASSPLDQITPVESRSPMNAKSYASSAVKISLDVPEKRPASSVPGSSPRSAKRRKHMPLQNSENFVLIFIAPEKPHLAEDHPEQTSHVKIPLQLLRQNAFAIRNLFSTKRNMQTSATFDVTDKMCWIRQVSTTSKTFTDSVVYLLPFLQHRGESGESDAKHILHLHRQEIFQLLIHWWHWVMSESGEISEIENLKQKDRLLKLGNLLGADRRYLNAVAEYNG